jgi:tetratricopeptide (TPR) repeat protein
MIRTGAVVAAIVAVVAGMRVYHDAYYIESRRTDRFGVGWNRLVQPKDATDWVNRSGLRGPMLNHLNFGGWLMWSSGEPVFIDGRLEVIGEDFYRYYRSVLASDEALEACAARYGIRWIVFPYSFNPRLLARLSRNPRWELAYVDHLAAIFVRRTGGLPQGITRSLPAPVDSAPELWELPGVGNLARPGRTTRWLAGLARREQFPALDHNLGLFHLYRGELEHAGARFARAISESGGAYYETYNNLAAVLHRMERYDDARLCYAIVLEEDPENRIAKERMDGTGRGSGSIR